MDKHRDAQFFVEAKQVIEYLKEEKIGAICISIGPGMFTALRVGLSLGKGLAFGQNIPIVAVNTLDTIGIPMAFLQYPILAVINAYHEEIYAALYKQGKRVSDYLLTTPKEVRKIIKNKTLVLGSGIEVFKKLRISDSKFYFIDNDFLLPTASKVISIALPRIYDRNFDKLENLEPFYIKKTDAERNYDQVNAF